MRCSYRCRDLKQKFQGLPGAYTNNKARLNYYLYDQSTGELNRSLERESVSERINLSENKAVRNFYSQIREIIELRASTDEDDRFAELSEMNNESDETFFSSYIQVFSNILGEQAGIMYSKGAFSKGHMLNDQNVSLLAEVVDHDITEINLDFKKNPHKIIEQLGQTYSTLLTMVENLHLASLITTEQAVEALNSYALGIKHKLTEKGELEEFISILQNLEVRDGGKQRQDDFLYSIERAQTEIKEMEEEIKGTDDSDKIDRLNKRITSSSRAVEYYEGQLVKERNKRSLPGEDRFVDQRDIFTFRNGGGMLYLFNNLINNN